MDEKKIKLNVKGLTNSQIQSNAFALILTDEESRRIPIIIGTFEAQSIAIALEGVHPPRPLTHDLMLVLMNTAGFHINEIYIHKFEDGVFYSEIVMTDDYREIRIDSRPSDAIALALRTKSDIYTTEKVMKQCCITFDKINEIIEDEDEDEDEQFSEEISVDYLNNISKLKSQIKKLHKKDIEDRMTKAIADENYELAKIYNDELSRR